MYFCVIPNYCSVNECEERDELVKLDAFDVLSCYSDY